MLEVEIVLVLIGVAFLVGSYFVEEKFSERDIQEISKMSETELKVIVEKQVNNARTQVENSVDEIVEDVLATTRRGLEKETNEKIMAVSEYSDTVLESMNKTHNEIMFLYSMLNDKQQEITEVVGAIQKYSKNGKNQQPAEVQQTAAVSVVKPEVSSVSAVTLNQEQEQGILYNGKVQNVQNATFDEKLNNIGKELSLMEEESLGNRNEQILALHKFGKTDVEIAKLLDCGLGEVRLVLGLYKEG